MATKLNKRFILILTAVILILGVGVAAVAYFAIAGDASRQVKMGEEMEAQGKYRDAIGHYGRAIGREPMNLDHYDRFERALLQIVPETRIEALNKYKQYIALLEKRKGASVDNPESWDRLIQANRRRAVLTSGSGEDVWQPVQEQAERMTDQFDSNGDEASAAANLMARGIALQAMSMRMDLLKPREETYFDDEADTFLEIGSKDPLVWEALLNRRLVNAIRFNAKGDTRLLQRELDGEGGFDAIAEKMRATGIEMTPELLSLQIRREQLLENFEESEAYQQLYAEFQELIDSYVEELTSLDSLEFNSITSDRLRRAILTNVLTSSDVIAKMTPLLDAERLELDLCMLLFQNLVQVEPELAQRAAEQVLAIDPLPVGLLSMMQAGARGEAALALFDSLYFQRAMDSERFTIADLQVAREQAIEEFQGDGRQGDVTSYLDGSISLASGDAVIARSKFSEIADSALIRSLAMSRRFVPRFVTALVLSGERGVAIDQLQQYADSLPPSVVTRVRVSIAGELFMIGQLEDALEQVSRVLISEPSNEEALELRAAINERVATLEQAPAGSSTPESRLYSRTRAALAEGRLEDARMLLIQAINDFDDVIFKRMLISVDTLLGNKEEARAVAATIENAESDESLRQQLVLLDVDDPIERITALAEASFDDAASINALRYVYLQDLARTDNVGNEQAKFELPAAFEASLADLTTNRGLTQRVVLGAIEDDRANGVVDTPDATINRVLEELERVETDEVQVLNTKARVHASLGRPKKALEVLEPLTERGVDTAHTWYTRGMAYSDLGRLDEATDAFRQAVDRAPDNWRFVSSYAQILESSGEYDQALAVLRASRRSEAMALQLREPWLDAESFYGDRRIALTQRMLLYLEDTQEREVSKRIIDMSNALELARLLLVIPPDREDIKKPNGETKYSSSGWGKLSGSERRVELARARERRRDYAFGIIDEVESSGRDLVRRASVKLVRAQAFGMFEEDAALANELEELIACCNEVLLPEQRIRLISMLDDVGDSERADAQFELLAQTENLAELRTLISQLGRQNRVAKANEVARRVAQVSGLSTDRLVEAQTLLSLGDLEKSQAIVDELSAGSEMESDRDLKYAILIHESNLMGMMGQESIEEAIDLSRQELELSETGDMDASRQAGTAASASRAAAAGYFDRGLDSAKEAMEVAPGRLVPILRQHELMRARILMLEDASLEADMLENARLARDLSPVDWRANKCVMEAHLVMGNPREAMGVVDQYFRRGGLSLEAREALLGIARLEGTPGLAIPPLERAMELDPINPAWPRAIATMLMENDDVQGASDMWWRVLELDASPSAVDQFVELEFRRNKPNMKRISEAFAMKPEVVENKPELKAAKAAMFAYSDQPSRAMVLYEDAYNNAIEQVENGASAIVIDRVLSYYFKVFENEDLADCEDRLRKMRGGPLGANEYGALADQAMRGTQEERDLESAIKYLRLAAEQPADDVNYRRALLHRLATILYVTKDCDGAVRALEEVISLGGATGSTLNNLAYMMLECRNDPEGAHLYSSQAIQVNPASPHFLDTHGFILFKLGRVEEAEVLLTRAVSIKPSFSNLLHLAQLMHATGRNDEAEILLDKLGKEFPRLAPEQQEEVNKLIAAIS